MCTGFGWGNLKKELGRTRHRWDDSILKWILNTGCHRRKGPNFGRVFLMLNYTDITQNTYIQS